MRNACLSDCKYAGFGYALDGLGQCFPKSTLLNGFSMPSSIQIMHLKVPRAMVISQAEQRLVKTNDLNCSNAEIVLKRDGADGENNNINDPFSNCFTLQLSHSVHRERTHSVDDTEREHTQRKRGKPFQLSNDEGLNDENDNGGAVSPPLLLETRRSAAGE
ncbi:unnamed protein product [Ilex paraguariensis]|uniref:Uncharacterized protein n=1 Tax=Ilex paraguariensis TaxID=185542 RepID=A0ABC8QQQ5_9AQUA